MKYVKYLILILISFMFLSFCSCSYTSNNKKTEEEEKMPNPAAVYCHDVLGGEYLILKDEGGVCKCPDGEIIGHDELIEMTGEWIKNRDSSD